MTVLGLLLFSITVYSAEGTAVNTNLLGVFNYHNRFGIPEADRIWKLENGLDESGQRVAGGSTTTTLSVPYQVSYNN